MSVRPWRDIQRKNTKQISVGEVKVGGDAPITVQSMTCLLYTYTSQRDKRGYGVGC